MKLLLVCCNNTFLYYSILFLLVRTERETFFPSLQCILRLCLQLYENRILSESMLIKNLGQFTSLDRSTRWNVGGSTSKQDSRHYLKYKLSNSFSQQNKSFGSSKSRMRKVMAPFSLIQITTLKVSSFRKKLAFCNFQCQG